MLFRSARGNFGFIPSFSRENVIYNTVPGFMLFYYSFYRFIDSKQYCNIFLYFIGKDERSYLIRFNRFSRFSLSIDIVRRVKKEERKRKEKITRWKFIRYQVTLEKFIMESFLSEDDGNYEIIPTERYQYHEMYFYTQYFRMQQTLPRSKRGPCLSLFYFKTISRKCILKQPGRYKAPLFLFFSFFKQ